MDPLTAVSLAGTVVAFVDVSLKLISRASEIYNSASGSSSEEMSLEIVYGTLSECSANLSSAVERDVETAGESRFPRSYACIRTLAQACQADCAAMLRILGKLKEARKVEPDDSSLERLAKSLRGALKALFKDPELKDVEARLQRTQTALTLELCSISSAASSAYHEQQLKSLEALKKISIDYQTQHSEQLEEIQSILNSLEQRKIVAKASTVSFDHDDVQGLEMEMSKLSVATRDVAYQQQILKGLAFETFHFRHHDILEAHEETFHWALREDGKRAETQERLGRWLTSGTAAGTFWVSGKPGSGKSTFMKYVVHSDETRNKLARWAQSHRLIIASHYLWYRGSPMQRSHQGLLRTLLFDIFRQHPHLISLVLDDDTGPLQKGAGSSWGTQPPERISWDIPRLRSALENLTSGKAAGVKFCLFIDGLDEFEGDHVELSQYLVRLSESPLVKLCVSSRPWNVFEDAFGNDPSTKLYMHEINDGDILRYTRSRLFGHPRWKLLLVQHVDAHSLVGEILKRSRGVFLWVFLVTRMLREGLTNDDSFTDLGMRLSSFPSDLFTFFRDIIESVDPIYQERMVGCLQLAQAAIQPLETLLYYFHDVQYDSHVHAPHKYSPPGVLDHEYKTSLQKHAVRRLNAYGRGLLESRNGKVGFLHRTVADFLDTPEMVRLLADKSRARFDPLLSILACFASLLETQRHEPHLFSKNLNMAMAYVGLVEERDDGSSAKAHLLLDKISGYLPLSTAVASYTRSNFIKLAVKSHLLGYLRVCLQRDPDYCDGLDPDVINVALRLLPSAMKQELLAMFFEHEHSRDLTDAPLLSRVNRSWTKFIHTVTAGNIVSPETPCRQFLENPGIYRQFLRHGANPNAVMYTVNAAHSQYSIAWVELLKPALRFRLDKADQEMYLKMLDLLIDHGAQISEAPARDQVYSLFCSELEHRPLSRKRQCEDDEPEISRREFIADVIMRLIRKVDWDMSLFWPAIEKFLGVDLLEPMQAAAKRRDQAMDVIKATRLVKASCTRSMSPGVAARKRRRRADKSQQRHLPATPTYVISDSDDDADEDRKPATTRTGSGTMDDPVPTLPVDSKTT
ncbi:nacht nucleoside triphosphatase [Apiospora arundinis]|uniref:Nacht nucleoside triphosphatase n=1 Tax=Apiospora arundinis TaxID=335852 RepID=A0ABR2JPK6_9PEZI